MLSFVEEEMELTVALVGLVSNIKITLFQFLLDNPRNGPKQLRVQQKIPLGNLKEILREIFIKSPVTQVSLKMSIFGY